MALIDPLLRQMIDRDASDIHLSTGQRVRMRLHGELIPISDIPLEDKEVTRLMREICRKDQWERFEKDQELDFAYGIEGLSRFRCNYFVHSNGNGAVFRSIPERIKSLEELDMPKVLHDITTYRSGLVLVTGPTGSGKSTTMAAMINEINTKQQKLIISIEDPVEFVHSNKKSLIFQREVGHSAKSFYDALKEGLHQDPDVLLVGEMRDLETISLALKAAEMGVLVLGTIHTNSAPKTLDRIIDSFPADQQSQVRAMLSHSLRAIVSQVLLRKKDGSGRLCALEVLCEGPGLSNLIREGAISKLYSYMQTHRSLGMMLMDESLQKMVLDGQVTAVDAYHKANDKKGFETFLSEHEIEFDVDAAFRVGVERSSMADKAMNTYNIDGVTMSREEYELYRQQQSGGSGQAAPPAQRSFGRIHSVRTPGAAPLPPHTNRSRGASTPESPPKPPPPKPAPQPLPEGDDDPKPERRRR